MRIFLLMLCALPLWGVTGDITAIRIVGAQTTVADTKSACNNSLHPTCSGWAAEVDVAGLNTGGTYAMGYAGTDHNPAAAKLVCTITGSGYDASATLHSGTQTRTVYGTHPLRRVVDPSYYGGAYVNGFSGTPIPNDETVVGGTLTMRIALSDFAHQGETATCNVAAGLYTQGGTPTNVATNIAVTNNSTMTYAQARVIANWSWPGWSRITSNTLTVRAVGYHRSAKNGKPLAAMKFTATDQHAHTASVLVTDMTIDPAMPDAGGKVQEYIGNINVAGFTQGDLVTVNFVGYPWVGDATSLMDTSDAVNTMPTPLYAPQFYIYDAAGTYGTSAAVVDASAGNDATCVAVSEAVFNASPNSNAATSAPCLTIKKAAVIIRAWNAAFTTHADVSGAIYLQAGSYPYTGATTSVTASSGTNFDGTWVTITAFPGVARSSVILTDTTTSGNRAGAATVLQKISGITINFTINAPSISAGKYIWFHGNAITQTAGSTIGIGTAGGVAYYTQNVTGTGGAKIGNFSSNSIFPALMRGNDVSTMNTSVVIYTVLGNLKNSPNGITTGTWQENSTTSPISNAPIYAYNRSVNYQVTASVFAIFSTQIGPLGAVIAGNVLEGNATFANQSIAYTIGTNGGDANNVMNWSNTYTGARIFHAYDDDTVSPDFATGCYMRSLWSARGNIWESIFTKTDVFAPNQNPARTCNWGVLFGAGFAGNVDAYDGTDVSHPVGFARGMNQEWTGIYTKSPLVGSSLDTQSTTQPALNSTVNPISYVGWVNRQAFDGSNPGTSTTGNGDYHLTAGSPAIARVPAALVPLPYDYDGTPRKMDGTAAAGALEGPATTTFRRRGLVIQ